MGPPQRADQQPLAVIAGLDDARGVYAARALARHKVPVIGIAHDRSCFGSRTNVCQKIIFASTNNEELIRALEVLGRTLTQKAALIPCLDMSTLLISRHRQSLEQWYYINLPAPPVLEMLFDKVAFYRFAEKTGLPIPRTFYVHDLADIELIQNELDFPCVLKPASSKTPSWLAHTHVKAFKIQDVQELRAAVEEHRTFTDTLIVQDWIQGGDDALYMSFVYFDARAHPLVTFTCRKLRQWLPRIGDTCFAEECSNDFVLGETLRLCQTVGFHGLGFIEFKCDPQTGKLFIVEPNIRVAACMSLAEAAGVELLYTMYCDMIGARLPDKRKQLFTGLKWIYVRKDIQSALYYWLRRELTINQWWRSLGGRKVDALLSWHDPGPFWYDLVRALRLAFSPRHR